MSIFEYNEDVAVKKMNNSRQSFETAIKKATKRLTNDEVVKFQKKVSLEAVKRIMMKTPVDTGRARGNWQTTINKFPSATEIENYRAEVKTGDPLDGTEEAKALDLLKNLKPYSTVYISNNLEYIVYLEEGSSGQAPTGMVKITVEELKEMISK